MSFVGTIAVANVALGTSWHSNAAIVLFASALLLLAACNWFRSHCMQQTLLLRFASLSPVLFLSLSLSLCLGKMQNPHHHHHHHHCMQQTLLLRFASLSPSLFLSLIRIVYSTVQCLPLARPKVCHWLDLNPKP